MNQYDSIEKKQRQFLRSIKSHPKEYALFKNYLDTGVVLASDAEKVMRLKRRLHGPKSLIKEAYLKGQQAALEKYSAWYHRLGNKLKGLVTGNDYLYHGAHPKISESILKKGLRPGSDGLTWTTRDPDVARYYGPDVLKITIPRKEVAGRKVPEARSVPLLKYMRNRLTPGIPGYKGNVDAYQKRMAYLRGDAHTHNVSLVGEIDPKHIRRR